MGKGFEQIFSQRSYMKKMLNIISQQGNINQSHNKIPLYIPQNNYDQKDRLCKCQQGSGTLMFEIIKWYRLFEKQFGSFSNVKHKVIILPSHSTCRYMTKRSENMFTRKLLYECLQQRYSLQSKVAKYQVSIN